MVTCSSSCVVQHSMRMGYRPVRSMGHCAARSVGSKWKRRDSLSAAAKPRTPEKVDPSFQSNLMIIELHHDTRDWIYGS